MWVNLPPHNHILPIRGVVDNFGPLPSLVLPWAENGTLNSYLRSHAGPPSIDRRITLVSTSMIHLQLNYLNVLRSVVDLSRVFRTSVLYVTWIPATTLTSDSILQCTTKASAMETLLVCV